MKLTLARVSILFCVVAFACAESSNVDLDGEPGSETSDASAGARRDASTPEGPPPSIELGTGDLEFMPLRDGDLIPIHFGPQGGYHLWMALRVIDGSVGSLRLESELFDEDGAQLFGRSTRAKVSTIPEELAGFAVYIRAPERAIDHQILLRVTAEDAFGRAVSDMRTLTGTRAMR